MSAFSLGARGRLPSLADSLEQSLPNPSCDRCYARNAGKRRCNFGSKCRYRRRLDGVHSRLLDRCSPARGTYAQNARRVNDAIWRMDQSPRRWKILKCRSREVSVTRFATGRHDTLRVAAPGAPGEDAHQSDLVVRSVLWR